MNGSNDEPPRPPKARGRRLSDAYYEGYEDDYYSPKGVRWMRRKSSEIIAGLIEGVVSGDLSPFDKIRQLNEIAAMGVKFETAIEKKVSQVIAIEKIMHPEEDPLVGALGKLAATPARAREVMRDLFGGVTPKDADVDSAEDKDASKA